MAEAPIRVLLVDDDEDDYVITRDLFASIPGRPFQLDWVETFDAARVEVAREAHDVYLVDYRLGSRTGLDLVRERLAAGARRPFILLTGGADHRVDNEAIRAGAEDYLIKGEIDARLLDRAIRHAIERKQVDDRLRRAQRDFRRVIEQTPDCVAIVRAETVVYANPAFAAAMKYATPEDLVGCPLADLVHPSDLARVEHAQHRADIRMRRADGDQAVLELTFAPLEDFEGEPAVVLVGRDVSERHRLLANLMMADRLLSVATLAAGVAHEVNNPLAYVLSNLGYLAEELAALGEGVPSDRREDLRQTIAEACEGAERVRDIVYRLRRFAQPDSESIAPIDVREVLDWAVQMASTEIRECARIVTELGPVPATLASGRRLSQVFLNILLNAAQAMKPGGPEQNEIRIRTRTDGEGRAVIEFRDNGHGIPRELQARIFDMFFTTRPPGRGMGIGLSICHSTVRAYGGDIEVESTVDHGSTFRVILPPARAVALPNG